MKLILGSSSRFRREVMEDLDLEFEVASPQIDEKIIRNKDPKKLVLAIANAKIEALLDKIKEPAVIVAADQVVLFKGKILEKPESKEQAKKFLKGYGEEKTKIINGLVAVNTESGKRTSGVNISTVYLELLPDRVINKLVEEEIVLSCAGALRHEDPLMKPYMRKLIGSYDSLMGLPKKLTLKLIKEVGY